MDQRTALPTRTAVHFRRERKPERPTQISSNSFSFAFPHFRIGSPASRALCTVSTFSLCGRDFMRFHHVSQRFGAPKMWSHRSEGMRRHGHPGTVLPSAAFTNCTQLCSQPGIRVQSRSICKLEDGSKIFEAISRTLRTLNAPQPSCEVSAFRSCAYMRRARASLPTLDPARLLVIAHYQAAHLNVTQNMPGKTQNIGISTLRSVFEFGRGHASNAYPGRNRGGAYSEDRGEVRGKQPEICDLLFAAMPLRNAFCSASIDEIVQGFCFQTSDC